MSSKICNCCEKRILNSRPYLLSYGHVFHVYCLMLYNIYRRKKVCPKCEADFDMMEYDLLKLDFPPIPPEDVENEMRSVDVPEPACMTCEIPFVNGKCKSFSEPFILWICEHKFHLQCIKTWVKDGNRQCPHCDTPITSMDLAFLDIYPDDRPIKKICHCPWSSEDEMEVDSWSDALEDL